MSSRVAEPGAIKRLWLRWKAIRLPWRKQFLVGADLAGNTFWEFKDALNANRLRRIVRYDRRSHYADIKISPQWHQWLRHTRWEPPSIEEQKLALVREAQMKQLAAQADERWRSQESFLDAPDLQQSAPAIGVKDPGGYAQQTEPEERAGVKSAVDTPSVVDESTGGAPRDERKLEGKTGKKTREREDSPWANARRGAPGEDWQPQSWSPGPAQRR